MNDTQPAVRVIRIVEGTSVDGPGLRTSIYFAGCAHGCLGCHNPQSWPFDAGENLSIDEIMKVILYNNFNVTFTGGDPLYQAEAILPLAKAIKEYGYSIWCYTGFLLEELQEHGTPAQQDLLGYIDVLVDGPFVLQQRDISLRFRGSSNQRIIDLTGPVVVELKLD